MSSQEGATEGQKKPVKVTCPTCGREADFFAEPVGPFCSIRCKMADLNRWFNEDYTISSPLPPDGADEDGG